jgi:clan AA aspartic protease (TIGR02281 family)
MEPNAPNTLQLIRTLIERCAVAVVGFSILMLIVSYHPDAATEHLETQYLNKKDAWLQKGEATLAQLKGQAVEVAIAPQENDKPSLRLVQPSEAFSPVPASTPALTSTQEALSPFEKEAPTAQQAQNSVASKGPLWFQNFKRSFAWPRTTGKEALPTLVDKPLASSVSSSPRPSATGRKSSFTTVPMSFEPKALFVKVNVNDRSSGHFILDTGATYTTISRKMAEDLGLDLRNSETISITTANGDLQVPKVRLKTVKVNNIQASDVEATVMDFENNASFSGLLGLSFIQHFKLTLDPQNGQMRFEPIR